MLAIMQRDTTLAPRIAYSGDGRVISAFGDEAIVHLAAENTGGMLTLWTTITPPGGGPPPHYHLYESEWYVVLEGQVQFLIGGQWRDVPPGSTVFAPRGTVHSFKNAGDGPSRMLVSTSPGGFEIFLSRCAKEFAKAGGPDPERLTQIGAEHGIHFLPEDQTEVTGKLAGEVRPGMHENYSTTAQTRWIAAE
jgi:quercetin dioxygenase-like cupin family protein